MRWESLLSNGAAVLEGTRQLILEKSGIDSCLISRNFITSICYLVASFAASACIVSGGTKTRGVARVSED